MKLRQRGDLGQFLLLDNKDEYQLSQDNINTGLIPQKVAENFRIFFIILYYCFLLLLSPLCRVLCFLDQDIRLLLSVFRAFSFCIMACWQNNLFLVGLFIIYWAATKAIYGILKEWTRKLISGLNQLIFQGRLIFKLVYFNTKEIPTGNIGEPNSTWNQLWTPNWIVDLQMNFWKHSSFMSQVLCLYKYPIMSFMNVDFAT